jgi:heavy metal sensor kinase
VNRLDVRSIRFRLTAWYAAILLITFAIVEIGVFMAIKQSTRRTIDRELRSRLAIVRAYVDQQTASADLSHLLEELNEATVMSPAATNLTISDARGRWIYRSPGTESWGAASPAALSPDGRTETIQVHGQPLRIISARAKIGALQIGLPLDQLEQMQREFLWTTALGAPAVLIFATLGGFWMSGRALNPVDEIARAAQHISIHNLSERLPGQGSGDELQRLSAVLNGMLARLESAFKKISQFTADASHELRTPVAIIRTTAEVTQSRSRTIAEHAKAWHVIQTQAERMSQLIDDLLTLARADSGSDELIFELVPLDEIVRDACSQMQIITEAKGLTLQMRLSAGCTVSADTGALRRALLIILDNATKASPAPGAIEVVMSAHFGSFAQIEVRDHGAGISSDDLPHIFERFYRASKDRSRTSGGAGLGLAIAQSIVTRHGGEITVESTPGAGSAFHLRLPVAAEPPTLL